MKVLARIHYARRSWSCALCPGMIQNGEPYRYVYPEGRKTVAHAHVKCSDPILREQAIRQLAKVTGKPIEEVRKAWEEAEQKKLAAELSEVLYCETERMG